MSRPQNKVHAVREGQDAEMAGALGFYVNAVCGYRWIPEKFDDECAGMKQCEVCFPPEKKKTSRGGPRDTTGHDLRPHYIYRCYDAADRLIYVGCTNNPNARMKTHKSTSWWSDQTHTVRLIVFPNRRYALTKEREAIATEMPRWNVKGKWSYRTDAWTAEDYIDFRHAIVQAVETTHHVYGNHTRALLADIDHELERRFGVTAMRRGASA